MELNKQYYLIENGMRFTPIARRQACYIGWIDDPARPEPVPAWTINKVNIHDAVTGQFDQIFWNNEEDRTGIRDYKDGGPFMPDERTSNRDSGRIKQVAKAIMRKGEK